MEPDQTFGSRYEQFVSLYRMTGGKKLLALSETSTVPDVNLLFRDNTVTAAWVVPIRLILAGILVSYLSTAVTVRRYISRN